MLETVEFVIDEDRAQELLAPDEGTVIADLVRKIEVAPDDPLYERIGTLDHQARQDGGALFASWEIRRTYSRDELETAQLLRLVVTSAFEPTAEECGTTYDETTACTICGVGRAQKSDLILDLSRLPKVDIARSLAEEWIVSQRLAELVADEEVTGIKLRRVHHKPYAGDRAVELDAVPSGRELLARAAANGVADSAWDFDVWLNRPDQASMLEAAEQEYRVLQQQSEPTKTRPEPWYQLIPAAEPTSVVPPTRFGIDPFDEDSEGEYRCPRGHLAGLAVLSELHVSRDTWHGTDVAVTDKCVGLKQGVLMPAPLILISPRFWRLLEENDIRGYEVEVAHLV